MITPEELERLKALAKPIHIRHEEGVTCPRCKLLTWSSYKDGLCCDCYYQTVLALIAEVERLREMTEPRPIETAPKEDGPSWIQFYCPICDERWKNVYWDGETFRTLGGMDVMAYQPTHWMPLPPVPQEAKSAKHLEDANG